MPPGRDKGLGPRPQMEGGPAWSGASSSNEWHPGIVWDIVGCRRVGVDCTSVPGARLLGPHRPGSASKRVSARALRPAAETLARPGPSTPPLGFGERWFPGAHTGACANLCMLERGGG